MEQCPVEIISAILSLACTDGGATGSSLALVSKSMASMSEPHRYQSVMLVGNGHIEAFLSVFLSSKDKDHAIKHLFICDRKAEKAAPEVGFADIMLLPHSRIADAVQVAQAAVRAEASRFSSLVLQLLHLAAPSLETLSLVTFDPSQRGIFWDTLCVISFPALTDLSFRVPTNSRDVSFCRTPFDFSAFSLDMPRLERLHLAYTSDMLSGVYQSSAERGPQYPLLAIFLCLASGPSITSIRLSDMEDFSRPRAGASLAHVLGFEIDENIAYYPHSLRSDFQDPFPRLPRLHLAEPSRTRIAIRPRHSPMYNNFTSIQLNFLMRVREAMVTHNPKGTADVPKVDIMNFSPSMAYEDWRSEWLKRQMTDSPAEREQILFYEEETVHAVDCITPVS